MPKERGVRGGRRRSENPKRVREKERVYAGQLPRAGAKSIALL